MGNSFFQTVALEQIAGSERTAFAMGPFGSRIKKENYVRDGIPVLRGINLHGERLLDQDWVYLTPAKAQELASSKATPGDIVFVAQGSVGAVGFIPYDSRFKEFVLSQNLMKVSCNPETADPLFVFYYFRSDSGQSEIMSYVNPTGVPCISQPLTSLKRFRVCLPSLKDQQAIAAILGALDDKIELNRKMNQTLEEMAQAIFKSWFIDFDPVRYKAAGLQLPGLAPHIADLFPDALDEIGAAEVPAGWHTSPMGDVAIVFGGGTPSTKEPDYWENGIHPFCTPKDMSNLENPVLVETERCLTHQGLNRVSSGQLPVGTVLMSSRAPIGYLAISEIPVTVNQGIIALVCSGPLPNVYVLNWLKLNMDKIVANANGSTFLEISKKNFRQIEILVPSTGVLRKYKEVAGVLYRKIVCNTINNRVLSRLRDALLPKLISGELRVPDAERIVGRAL